MKHHARCCRRLQIIEKRTTNCTGDKTFIDTFKSGTMIAFHEIHLILSIRFGMLIIHLLIAIFFNTYYQTKR